MAPKKVYLLDGGSLVIDRSQLLWHIDIGTPVRFPVYSVLIEHPDGLFMYDTGYDLDHVNRVLPFEQPLQTKAQSLTEQLRLCGFEPEQVNFVANSHFHFDHVGGNRFLTEATTLVSKEELRHAKVPEPFEHLG
ncbi:MAG TPA: MBL fold metallo-hydrolase, partial [Acidimicrobiales bacterium]|nr:MBL fold metallo-hydrolase [Acidimicrobiales bacterium]